MMPSTTLVVVKASSVRRPWPRRVSTPIATPERHRDRDRDDERQQRQRERGRAAAARSISRDRQLRDHRRAEVAGEAGSAR